MAGGEDYCFFQHITLLKFQMKAVTEDDSNEDSILTYVQAQANYMISKLQKDPGILNKIPSRDSDIKI